MSKNQRAQTGAARPAGAGPPGRRDTAGAGSGTTRRVLSQIGLPASRIIDNEYARDSGAYHLVIQAPRAFSVPYGIYPRGILTWLVTEIVNRKNRKKSEGRIIEAGILARRVHGEGDWKPDLFRRRVRQHPAVQASS